MSAVLMMLGFLVAGAILAALGAWWMIRRWPLQVEDLLGYFGLLAPDDGVVAPAAGTHTESSRQRRRGRRRPREPPSAQGPSGPEGPAST